MQKRELITPGRFDSRDAAAGLKAIEESGHAAGDLGQAADAASARFRKAHESVQSAMQEYHLLRQSLQQSPGHETTPTSGGLAVDNSAEGITARLPAGEWLESREGLRSAAGARLGGPASNVADEQAGRLQHGSPGLSNASGLLGHQAAEPSDSVVEVGHGGNQTKTGLSMTGIPAGPGDPQHENSLGLGSSRLSVLGRAIAPPGGPGASVAIDPDDRRDGSANDSMRGDRDMSEIRAGVARRQGFAKGSDEPGGDEPAGFSRPERMAPGATADYVEWMTGDRDGSGGRVGAARRAGTAAADDAGGAAPRNRQALQEDAGVWRQSGDLGEGVDPRDAIWRTRGSSPIAASADDANTEEWTQRPARGSSGISPGERSPEARSGGASTGVIERLLREQNELIKQDLQQSAYSPIAAPPPMRGGGIRM
jgi:hypothetical protein